jgi:hypothetical protein
MNGEDEEFTIRNIPASVVSDINNLDGVIGSISDMAESPSSSLNWDEAEIILGALQDVRSALLYLAEKHDALVVKLQEYES